MATILCRSLVGECRPIFYHKYLVSSDFSRMVAIQDLLQKTFILSNSFRFISIRNQSNRSRKSKLVEINLDNPDHDVEVLGIRRLEDAINAVIARRSAPVWMPFLPGSSYWVPPQKKAARFIELVGRLKSPTIPSELEDLSSMTNRGFPSSSFFLKDESSHSSETEDE